MAARSRPFLVAGAIALALAFLLLLWWRTGERADAGQARYVGREICAGCHSQQAALWAGSHHDLSMQVASDQSVLGDFDDATFAHREKTSRFFRRAGRFYALTEGADGAPAELEVAYTFGVHPLQQYLVALPGGRYQALNVAWDSRAENAGGQRWFHLYPDAEVGPDHPLHWTRPSQNWNTVCADCHSTGLVKGFDSSTLSFATTWSEIDVSCEACHGPGSEHVRVAASAPEGAQPRGGWGVFANASARSAEQLETCAHCHARRSVIGDGWRADRRLLDVDEPSLLREDLYHSDGQLLDEVFEFGSFVQSRMYRAGVTCTDCHEPHSLKLRAEGNALCTQCHQSQRYDAPAHHFHERASAGAECVSCHMPATNYMVVDPRRDHSLRVPRPDLSDRLGVPNACTTCHAGRTAAWASAALETWYGSRTADAHFADALDARRRGLPGAARALTDVARDTAQAPIVRATALSLLGDYPEAVAEGALAAGLRDGDPLLRLGALQALTDAAPPLRELARPLLEDPYRSLRIRAARLLAFAPSLPPGARGAEALRRALLEYERAQEANADHPSSWVNLGDLRALAGDVTAAENAYLTALRLDERYLPAHLNLADLMRASGNAAREEEVLARALELLPASPEVRHAWGLRAVRRGDAAGALAHLEQAARMSPETARFAYVYGVALASDGNMQAALSVLDDALARHPYDRDLLTALATYRRDLGDLTAALAHAQRLVERYPEDPDALALLEQLLALRPR